MQQTGPGLENCISGKFGLSTPLKGLIEPKMQFSRPDFCVFVNCPGLDSNRSISETGRSQ